MIFFCHQTKQVIPIPPEWENETSQYLAEFWSDEFDYSRIKEAYWTQHGIVWYYGDDIPSWYFFNENWIEWSEHDVIPEIDFPVNQDVSTTLSSNTSWDNVTVSTTMANTYSVSYDELFKSAPKAKKKKVKAPDYSNMAPEEQIKILNTENKQLRDMNALLDQALTEMRNKYSLSQNTLAERSLELRTLRARAIDSQKLTETIKKLSKSLKIPCTGPTSEALIQDFVAQVWCRSKSEDVDELAD